MFGFLAIPLTYISSAYVPVESMPDWLAVIAANQPVTHMVEALRRLLPPELVAGGATDVGHAIGWTTAATVIALAVAHRRLDA